MMRIFLRSMILFACFLGFVSMAPVSAVGADSGAADAQVRELQEKMLNDRDLMALVQALQNDPEVREVLNAPGVINAVNSGDFGSLASNPRFMKLLDNPRIREIQRRMQP